MTTNDNGVSEMGSAIGFGSFSTVVDIGGEIDTAGLTNEAFSMPRDGTITAIAAYFSVAADIDLPESTLTLTAQLYSSTTPDDVFVPIAGAAVTLASFTGNVAAGTTVNGIIDGLAIPVSPQTRLLLVFSTEITDGSAIVTLVNGFASAGINIV